MVKYDNCNAGIHSKWKMLLKERGVKQNWLASKTGISQFHISNILCGRVTITESNKRKINDVLNVDFN